MPDDLKQRVLGAIEDQAALPPEEDETWESWFHAAFDLAAQKISQIFDDHDAGIPGEEPAAIKAPPKGKPPAEYTPGEVQALGWMAEARTKDGKLVTVIAPDASDEEFGQFVREYRDNGYLITVFPKP